MSTLIPSITTCKFDAPGERRFARLLEAKLEDDYRCWYNVPIGPKRLHPDFINLNSQTGCSTTADRTTIIRYSNQAELSQVRSRHGTSCSQTRDQYWSGILGMFDLSPL